MGREDIKEDNATNPLNHYAESKLAGEKVLSNSNCSNITFRVSWLFSPFGSNFVKKILRLSEAKKDIKVVKDQFGKPTYGIDLARVVLDKLTHSGFLIFIAIIMRAKALLVGLISQRKFLNFQKIILL